MLDAAQFFGARVETPTASSRTVLIGSGIDPLQGWLVQAFWNGWIAGTTPGINAITIGRNDSVLAGVAAGALAVGQAFLAEQGDPRAGRSTQSLSLWTPELAGHGVQQPGPCSNEIYLPTELWLIGLGNLGQAYLWSLMFLPYSRTTKALLFLQDDQQIGKENWGTSVLVRWGQYGILKTRVAEDWAIARGFNVRRIDRRLDARLLRTPVEPAIALAGLDSMAARRLLGNKGFEYVIDAGLGATAADYKKFRINVFDASRNPSSHFQGLEDQKDEVRRNLMESPSYQELARSREDGGCGAALLAGTNVAVPFVSSFAAALAISQAVRIASAQAPHFSVTGDMSDLMTTRAVLGRAPKRVVVPSALTAF